MRPSPITLQMIADRAGVSRATASRALRNHPRLAKETVAKVQKLAKEMGYQSDPQLTSLMVHLRHRKGPIDRPVIALIIHQNTPFDPGYENGQSVHIGAIERVKECGYMPEIFNITELEAKGLDLGRVLYSRGIKGVIIYPFQKPGPLPALNRDHFSLVAIGHSIRSPHLHRAVTNQYQGMRDCIGHLVSHGYRRLGAILEERSDKRTNGFVRAAYLLERERLGSRALLPLLTYTSGEDDRWCSEFVPWFQKHRPDALIGSPEYIDRVQSWLQAKGIRTPEDLGIVSLHLPPGNRVYSGVMQNSLLVGAAAVDALLTLMQKNETGTPEAARIILVEGKWCDNGTTSPRPRAKKHPKMPKHPQTWA